MSERDDADWSELVDVIEDAIFQTSTGLEAANALVALGWRKMPDALAVLAVVNALGVDWLYDDPGSATDAILALMDSSETSISTTGDER